MSWSFSAKGTPDEVQAAIEASPNNQLTGQSLVEWSEAKPALSLLVGANKGRSVAIDANGHAAFNDGERTYGSCDVSLRAAT